MIKMKSFNEAQEKVMWREVFLEAFKTNSIESSAKLANESLEEYRNAFEKKKKNPIGDHNLPTLNIHDLEAKAITSALQLNKGNREKAAKLLGISSRTLFRRIQKNPHLS